MSKNKERIFLYFIYLMCFGIFIYTSNVEFVDRLFIHKNLKITEAIIGISLLISYYFSIWIFNSWIINLIYIYIYSYKKAGYEILSYNFFPVIYIKRNNKKIRLSFNIILLHNIGSMLEDNFVIKNEEDLIKFIENTKRIYLNIVHTHYYLILFGIIMGIFNFSLGGMIISYNIAIILYQSINNDSFWGYGYVYLSKNFTKEHLIYVLKDILKVQQNNKINIYKILQSQIIYQRKEGIIINELCENIIIDSIVDDYNYLGEEIRKSIHKRFIQHSYFNVYEFFKNYRLYRCYCLYVLNFYGKDEYEDLIRSFSNFYLSIKSISIIKFFKMLEHDMERLKSYKFEKLYLKYKLDYCNKYDSYVKKLNFKFTNS